MERHDETRVLGDEGDRPTLGESVRPGTMSALLEELACAPDADFDGWMSPVIGSRLGRFELLRELGRGGFGVVYEARDLELKRSVALKAIKPGIRSLAELRRQSLHLEAEAVAQLSHPNIVILHDLGTSPSGPYLVLELLHGETLRDRLDRGPLPARETLDVALPVARAMAHAHTRGVFHRDLKPSNVFLCEDGGVKVLDFGLDCAEELEKALAVWLAERGGPWPKQVAAIEAAVRFIDRAPSKDRALIQAWKAHFDGMDEEALRIHERFIASSPGEVQPLYEAGDILHHRGDFAGAVSYFERVLALEPARGWALDHYVEGLGALGKTKELRALVARLQAMPPGPGSLHALSATHGWLGEFRMAAEVAGRSVKAGGGLGAAQDILYAALLSRDYAVAEAGLGEIAGLGSRAAVFGGYAQCALDGYRGARSRGRRRLDAMLAEIPPLSEDGFFHDVKASYLAGEGEAGQVWDEARRLLELDPGTASVHAVTLAYLGDLDHAALLARKLRPGTSRHQTYEALVLWRRGERGEALRRLREISALAPFDPDRGIAPVYLLGELSVSAGAYAEAAEALRRFQALYIPTAVWRSWAFPKSQYLLAASLARLGRDDEALRHLDDLLASWKDADPTERLLAEARALRALVSGRR